MATSEVQATSDDWRQLYPFKSHWTECASGRMHYIDEGPANSNGGGSGECLLFVHGNPTWSFHWRRLILAMRDRYRCVAPDHLGCGLSDKPQQLQSLVDHIANLRALVERLNLKHVTLVAQDWGGAIALGTMIHMCERLERIVLFNTGAFPPRYIPWRIRACRIPLIGRIAVQGGNLFSRAALRMTLARRKELDPAIRAGYLAPFDSWNNRLAVYGFVRDIPGNPDHPTWQILDDIERRLRRLAKLHVSLIWGMRDWCFRPDCLERFLEAWPQAEVHRLADVGHWVVEDAPEESLSIVDRFLGAGDGCQVSAVRSAHPTPGT